MSKKVSDSYIHN